MTTATPDRSLTSYRVKRRAYLNAHGITYYIDAAPTRAHLRNLTNRGAGWAELRDATGCSYATIYEILEGRRPRILRDVANRIQNVRLVDVLTPSRLIPALGSTRRVRALYAAGHGTRAIADLAGFGRSLICDIAGGQLPTVQYATAKGITRAYDHLRDSTGPCNRNRIRAQRERWPSPDRWHPDDLDEPDADPDPDYVDAAAVQRAVDGKPGVLTRAEQQEAARLMTVRGDTATGIAARIGVVPRTVTRWRTANGWKAAA